MRGQAISNIIAQLREELPYATDQQRKKLERLILSAAEHFVNDHGRALDECDTNQDYLDER